MDREYLQQEPMVKALVGSSNEILNDQEESMPRGPTYEAYNIASSIDGEIPSLEARGEKEWISRLRTGSLLQEQIPPEILGHIFKLCLEYDVCVDYDVITVNIPFHRRPQGLMLSHVCSHWRHVALVERSLWNTVSIDDPPRVRPDVLETILSRAGNSITFRLTMVRVPPPVLRVLHQYSDKFQSVKLDYDYSREVKHLDVPFAHLGALRKLQLEVEESWGQPATFDVHHAISAFANPSCLRRLVSFELHVPGVSVDLGTAAPLLLPWSQLEHLWICARLVPYKITLFPEEDGDTDSVTSSVTPSYSIPFTLPNLISLTLHSFDGVLDSIVAPSLRVLKIDNAFAKLDTLFRFLRRSKCNLQTLHIRLHSTPSPAIEQLLLASPGVLDLNVLGPHVMSETILDSIAMGTLLPNVEVLQCGVSSCRAVRNLVSNRCEPDPDGVKRVMQKFAVWVHMDDVTDEWREFQAPLQPNGAERMPVRVTLLL